MCSWVSLVLLDQMKNKININIDLGRPKSGAPIYYFFAQFNYSVTK